jgi:uncharacterized protein involved in outer membrane biogenesis
LKRGLKIAGIVLALSVATAIVVAMTMPLASVAAHAGRIWMGRDVEFASLSIGWGRRIVVEARGVRVANPGWAKSPDYVRIGAVSATIELGSLLGSVLGGPTRFSKLRVRDLEVDLERRPDGTRSWRSPGLSRLFPHSSGAAHDRTTFPTLEDLVLENGHVVYRGRSGKAIDIRLARVTVASPSEDAPVRMTVDGELNGKAVRLDGIDMGTFHELHDSSLPYKAIVDFRSAPAALRFEGSFTDPVNFDGFDGTVAASTPQLSAALEMFGAGSGPRTAFSLAGKLRRNDPVWKAEGAQGTLAGMAFTGTLGLDEGAAGSADRLHLGLSFAQLDIAPLMEIGGQAGGGTSSSDGPAMVIDGEVHARSASWQKLVLSDVVLRGKMDDKPAATLSFGIYGGRAEAELETPVSGRSTLDAHLAGADFDRLAQLAGSDPREIGGSLEARMLLELKGTGSDLSLASGSAVAAIANGSVSRKIVEAASTDPHAFFRDSRELITFSCALTVAALQGHVVHLPLARLRAPDRLLEGSGQIDLAQRQVEIAVRSRSGGTLALDAPLHIGGTLDRPSIHPSIGGPEPALPPLPSLPAPLQALVAGSACRE